MRGIQIEVSTSPRRESHLSEDLIVVLALSALPERASVVLRESQALYGRGSNNIFH